MGIPLLSTSLSIHSARRSTRRITLRVCTFIAGSCGAVGFAPAVLPAQATAVFNIGVYVRRPVSISSDRALAFGTVGAGVDKTIVASDAGNRSGRMTFQGAGCALADLRFTLPTVLAGPASATLPIDTWTGDWVGGQGGAPVAYTPSPAPLRFQFDHAGLDCGLVPRTELGDEDGTFVGRIGATVHPASNQTPGVYTAIVGVSVTYVDM